VSDDLETDDLLSESDAAPSRALALVVFGEEVVGSYPLPPSGNVVIGRSGEAQVCIDAPSISRRHAVIEIGPTLVLRDLASSNGTRLRGVKVGGEGAEIFPGDVLTFGSVAAMVQRAPEARRPRRIWAHGYFEARVEDEVLRARGPNPRFAVVRVSVQGRIAPATVQEAVAAELHPADCVAVYGPGEYELLLTDVAPARARERVTRLLERLEAIGADANAGVACFPQDGQDPDVLLAHACAALKPAAEAPRRGPVVVEHPSMVQLHKLVERVAQGQINVLILGETGTGKEVVAEAVHKKSPRARRPFVRLSCAALTEGLLESELFGHEKGAFTGATETKPGLLETAQGGTVMLDEIGEMPLAMQAKLLRVLEERAVRHVGGLQPIPIDVRFIAATHRNLESDIVSGRFRQDLYFRLCGIALVVPPLRERASEIAPLARAFIAPASAQMSRGSAPALSPEAVEQLEAYSWPGNIRELRNVIERAVLLCTGDSIGPEHLPLEKMSATWLLPEAQPPATPVGSKDDRTRIVDALARCAGNQSEAAKMLGISRRTMVKRLTEYGINRPRNRRA
jgi:two-component system response regulator AtoC